MNKHDVIAEMARSLGLSLTTLQPILEQQSLTELFDEPMHPLCWARRVKGQILMLVQSCEEVDEGKATLVTIKVENRDNSPQSNVGFFALKPCNFIVFE